MLMAYGRNRPAEAEFMEAAAACFETEVIPDDELHPVRTHALARLVSAARCSVMRMR